MDFAAPLLPLSRIGFQTSQNSGVGAACVCAWGPYAPHEIGPSVRYVPSCYRPTTCAALVRWGGYSGGTPKLGP